MKDGTRYLPGKQLRYRSMDLVVQCDLHVICVWIFTLWRAHLGSFVNDRGNCARSKSIPELNRSRFQTLEKYRIF